MGVAEVPGYGPITSGNAKEIYLAWKNGKVDLQVSQQKYCESFFSPSDWDEIEYDTGNNQKEGYEKVSDADKVKEHSDSGANVAATSGGTVAASVTAAWTTGKLGMMADGFSAVVASGIACAAGAVALVCSFLFDNAYATRKEAEEHSADTNAVIEDYNNQVVGSMDMMNEDMANYDAASQEYMVTVNSANAELADLQVQLADAEAAGDTEGAAAIRAQIAALQGQGYEGEEGELQEMRDGLKNYSALGDESLGVADAGDTVGEFLRDGKWIGPIGAVDTALLTAAGLFLALVTPIPKIAPIFPDSPAAVTAKVMFKAAALLFGGAATEMGIRTKKEFECGASGDEMGDKVDALKDVIEQQGGYIEETEGFYGAADEARIADNAEGDAMANKNSFDNDGGDIHSDPYAQGQGEGKPAA